MLQALSEIKTVMAPRPSDVSMELITTSGGVGTLVMTYVDLEC